MKATSSELTRLAQDCEGASAFNTVIDRDIDFARLGAIRTAPIPKFTFSRDAVRYLRPDGMTGMEVYPPSEDYPDWAVHVMGPWGHTEGFAVSEVLAECSACLKAWAKIKELTERPPFEDAYTPHAEPLPPVEVEEDTPESLLDFYGRMGVT